MDLVSFETRQEYDWVKGFIDGGVNIIKLHYNNCHIHDPDQNDAKVPFFWTSGRKCNFDGCDKPEFFPKLVNGWFWSANQVNEERICQIL